MALVLDGNGNGKVGDATVPLGTGTLGVLVRATAQSATGTSVDFTGIPDTASRVTVMFENVSLNSTGTVIFQLGDSGGIENTGYVAQSGSMFGNSAYSATSSTNGFVTNGGAASAGLNGSLMLTKLTGNTWVCMGVSAFTNTQANPSYIGGSKTLSGVLDRVRMTSANGTDQFDSGTVNIMWE